MQLGAGAVPESMLPLLLKSGALHAVAELAEMWERAGRVALRLWGGRGGKGTVSAVYARELVMLGGSSGVGLTRAGDDGAAKLVLLQGKEGAAAVAPEAARLTSASGGGWLGSLNKRPARTSDGSSGTGCCVPHPAPHGLC